MKYGRLRIPSLVFLLLFLLSGCVSQNADPIPSETVEPSISTTEPEPEPVESQEAESEEPELSAIERLEIDTGFKYMDYLFWEMDQWYTITFQRELIGGTYLIENWDFDIFQSEDRFWLKSVSRYYEIYLVELTEEQCNKILEYERFTGFAVAFEMQDVMPLGTTYVPEYNYTHDDYGMVDEDSISASIFIDPNYKIVYGSCVGLYVLDEDETHYTEIM